jgi:hypothetical protein
MNFINHGLIVVIAFRSCTVCYILLGVTFCNHTQYIYVITGINSVRNGWIINIHDLELSARET